MALGMLMPCLLASSADADDKAACMSTASKGQELRDDGRLVEAKALFLQCGEPSCPQPIPAYCNEWLANLNRKLPSIVFRTTDESGHDLTDATVEIDGKRTVPIDGRAVDIDPGKHTLRITRAAMRPFEDVIIVAEGEKDRIVVAKLAAPPAVATAPVTPPPKSEAKDEPKKSSVPTASWVAWGIGSFALLSFAGFGLKARVDYDDYEARCGNRCAQSERDTVASSIRVADISLAVAVVAAGVGTFFYLTRPAPPPFHGAGAAATR
jgi:hypothetical protein